MTPEGRVKAKVKKVLARYEHYGSWPVPSGYGKSTLDFEGCFHGFFFSIETKAPGEKPTPRQEKMIEGIKRAGGAVFVIDGDTGGLEAWLDHVTRASKPKVPARRRAGGARDPQPVPDGKGDHV